MTHPRYGSMEPKDLHVLTMISNPVRYTSRYRLWEEFNARMIRDGVTLWTAELQLGARPFVITKKGNPRHIQVRGRDELWAKENTLNRLAIALPDDWRYLAWIDADVEFTGRTTAWPIETMHILQHYQVAQLWETATELGPGGEAIHTHRSFASQYIKKGAVNPETAYNEWHPGYAWAITREAWDGMGGLLDFAVAGAGDRHMALAFVGAARFSYHPKAPEPYRRAILEWEQRQLPAIRRDLGYMPGHLLHYWHGKKRDRRYWDRWQIINDTGFNPNVDLVRNSDAIYELSMRGPSKDDFDKSIMLRDRLRHYFRQRNEDSVDLD
jgi:hypothetical protein